MYRNLTIAWLAIACLAIVSSAEVIKEAGDTTLNQQDVEAAIKAEFGDNVDISFDGYDNAALEARDNAGDVIESDEEAAAQHAQALADDEEDYDALPDGVDEATYQKELDEKDAEDVTIPDRRRDAGANPIVLLTAAEKKRLGRMRPHYVKHADRISDDLKHFMKRFADEAEGLDEDVDVSLDGYDHELVRREAAGIDDGDNDWEEPQEELKAYDHSKLVEGKIDLTAEEQTRYLKDWNTLVARDFEELEKDDKDDNDRYAAPEDTEAGVSDKRGLTRLQKMRKGVKVLLGHEF